MAHQIVATSVPRGLDGVSGYQTVLKSAGIPPRVFDRLKARSGYSHPYPHGDNRNPVVYVHRIEELAGSRWHVLGCIRDAGSDHTGRSNFLAHMLAIDSTEARGKPGGPAAAALVRGCFLDKWDRPPEPAAAAKTLVVADRPVQPGDVPAWRAAGLDPGLAGDLAAAAMANRKVVIVTRPGDDVLALFADALRLVEPSKRWGVTFNTCAIEDFDGIWKAVRADLAEAKDVRDSKALVIDLTTQPRGSTEPYAQFARGEAVALPWQKSSVAVPPDRHSGTAEEPAAKRAATKDPRPGATQGTARKNIARTGEVHRRNGRQLHDEEEVSRLPWRTFTIAALGLLLLGGLAAIPFRDQIEERIFGSKQIPKPPSIEPASAPLVGPVNPPPFDPKQTPEYRAATILQKGLARLKQGVNGKTYLQHQKEARAFIARLDTLRRGGEGQLSLKIMPENGDGADPRLAGVNAVELCDRVGKLLETTSGLELKTVEEAESDLKESVERLARAEKQVDALAAKERKDLEDRATAQESEDRQQRQRRAFADFQSLGQTVSLPTAHSSSGTDLGGPRPIATTSASNQDLGSFHFADLLEPTFRLAVPRDTINGQDFKAEIVRVDGESEARWQISYLPTAEDIAGGKEAAKPRPLAYLIGRDGRLFLEVPRTNELNLSPFAMLRRSVILVEAKDPSTPKAPAVRQEIRLVEPTKVPPLKIDAFAEHHQELKITPPNGVARPVGGADGHGILAIPISSLRVEADFPNGETVSLELPKDVPDPSILSWNDRLLADIQLDNEQPGQRLKINASIRFSLPQATITARTTWSSPQWVTKDKVKEFYIDNPEKKLSDLERRFRGKVKEGGKFRLSDGQTKQNVIETWFSWQLVNASWNMGVPMPGHETTLASFGIFLKEEYDRAAEDVQQDQSRILPKTYEEFFKRCQEVKDESQWQRVFTDRVETWAKWFWPRFEEQWHANVNLFQGALAVKHEVRFKAITSLAYDENGQVYDVPLIVGEDPNPPAGVGVGLGVAGDSRPSRDGPLGPQPAAGGSGSVGLD